MNILITGAAATGSHQLKKQLNDAHTGARILLGDYAELPALMVKSGLMVVLPNPADTSYAHKMLTLCLDKEVGKIYALQPVEFDLLNQAGLLFNEYGITIYCPNEIYRYRLPQAGFYI